MYKKNLNFGDEIVSIFGAYDATCWQILTAALCGAIRIPLFTFTIQINNGMIAGVGSNIWYTVKYPVMAVALGSQLFFSIFLPLSYINLRAERSRS
jgi:hypothetical protein